MAAGGASAWTRWRGEGRTQVAAPTQHGVRPHQQPQPAWHVPRRPLRQGRQERPVARGVRLALSNTTEGGAERHIRKRPSPGVSRCAECSGKVSGRTCRVEHGPSTEGESERPTPASGRAADIAELSHNGRTARPSLRKVCRRRRSEAATAVSFLREPTGREAISEEHRPLAPVTTRIGEPAGPAAVVMGNPGRIDSHVRKE